MFKVKVNKALFILCFCLISACSKVINNKKDLKYQKRAFPLMGSVLSLELWTFNSDHNHANTIYTMADDVNQQISHYSPKSQLSLINQRAGSHKCIELNQEFIDLLSLSLSDYKQSKKYFNPAVEPLITKLSKANVQSIEEKKHQTIKAIIDFEHQLKNKRTCFYLKSKGAYLNFSANGKGYVLKKIQTYLKNNQSIYKAKIVLGEQVLMWSKNKHERWQNYLRNPDVPSQAIVKWITGNGSIASSAQYGKQELYHNKNKAYIVDPVELKRVLKQKITSVYHADPYKADVFSTLFHILACDHTTLKKMYPKESFKALCLSNDSKKQIKQGQVKAKLIF